MLISLAFWAMLLVGLLASGAFLVLHRPQDWKRVTALNASGWVIVILLLYLRACISTYLAGWPIEFRGGAEQIIWSFGMGIAIDVLLVLRVRSFLKFKNAHEARHSAVTTQRYPSKSSGGGSA